MADGHQVVGAGGQVFEVESAVRVADGLQAARGNQDARDGDVTPQVEDPSGDPPGWAVERTIRPG